MYVVQELEFHFKVLCERDMCSAFECFHRTWRKAYAAPWAFFRI